MKCKVITGYKTVNYENALTPPGYHGCHIYIQTDAPSEYLADQADVHLVPYDNNWRTAAQARIEQHRKADITIEYGRAHCNNSGQICDSYFFQSWQNEYVRNVIKAHDKSY